MDGGLIVLLTALGTLTLVGAVFVGVRFLERLRSLEEWRVSMRSATDYWRAEQQRLAEKLLRQDGRLTRLETQLSDAQVLRVNPKTGAFVHTGKSEMEAEKEAGIGEALEIGPSKTNGRYEFLDLGGVDALDRPTMEEVSDNAGKETQRSGTDF